METLSAYSLPPGFGFHPTDVELISHYLRRKMLGQKIDFEIIPEVDIYKHEPWDLPARCQVPTRDSKWHFFTSRDKKYPNGSRANRATKAGYWKSTGKDRDIRSNKRIIGTKKTLVFHEGRPPSGKRTEWIMHEYYINENECKASPDMKGSYVLCRVTKRNSSVTEGENASLQTDEVDNCTKQPKDTALITPKETLSPSENTEDIDKWVTELFDPNFPLMSTFTEVKVEPQILQAGRDLATPKQQVADPRFLPEVSGDSYLSILQSGYMNFDAYGGFDMGSLDFLGDNHHDDFFQMSDDTPNDNTSDAEIEIRQRIARPVSATPKQKIKLQVSKMETINGKSVSKTIEVVDRRVHLDPYNENQHIMTRKTLSDASRAQMTVKTPDVGNYGGTSFRRITRGLLPSFLGWCTSATANCFFLSACMMGTGALISYFILCGWELP